MNNLEFRFPAFDGVIEEITRVEKLLRSYMLKEERMQLITPDYKLTKDYHKLRNKYEGIRLKKIELIRQKNTHLSYMSLN